MWSDSRQLDSLSVAIGELKGIAPAPDFDMLTCVSDPFPANLKTIKVRCGPYIDAIEVRYLDPHCTPMRIPCLPPPLPNSAFSGFLAARRYPLAAKAATVA